MAEPTPAQRERLKEAVIQKATRTIALGEASLGSWGEQDVVVPVRPDHTIAEMLYGMRGVGLEVDFSDNLGVTADDVIRSGLQADPDTYPEDRKVDVERALLSAVSWVEEALNGFGVA